MMASAIISSMMIFIDSYSMTEWNSVNDVGPASIVGFGGRIDAEIEDFRAIPGIEKAAAIRGTSTYLATQIFGIWLQANMFGMACDEDFLEAFPTIFSLVDGRFPRNDSEIAISVLVADLLAVDVGGQLNYSFTSTHPADISYRPAVVTGIFEHGESEHDNPYYYIRGHSVFHSSLSSDMTFSFIYADVDRSKVVPQDPVGSIAYLNGIDEQIRSLDPSYSRSGESDYFVKDFLFDGIEDYIKYLNDFRVSQVLRSGGLILLELAVIYLAINHVWNEREYEINMLVARGASRFRVGVIVNLEIVAMAFMAILPGLAVGIVTSRLAIASERFFLIDFERLIYEPFLISNSGLLYSIIAGLLLPLLVLTIHQMRGLVRFETAEKTGKLGRMTKALSFIKTDAVLLVLSIAFLVAFNMAGSVVARNQFLYTMLGVLPFTLFLGLTSLALKGLRRGAGVLSRLFRVFTGRIPASVGIRRISKATSTSGPLIMVIVLAMSLGWNYAINDATLPHTRLSQSRFAIGGDLAFHLDTQESEEWDSFFGNLTESIPSSTSSLLSILSLSLSTGTEGKYEFVALNPIEYSRVGYDSTGDRLNESSLGVLMEQMAITELGAIITQDIAESYELSVGGSLRAFWSNQTELQAIEFSIIGVVNALPDTLVFSGGNNPYPGIDWTYSVGLEKIWVNRVDVEHIFSRSSEVKSVFCMRVENEPSATTKAEDCLANGWIDVLEEKEWVSASREVDTYTSQDMYTLDRAADTLMTILSVGTIIGAFAVYAIEGITSRKREIALLRSLGAERNLVIKTQTSEMVVLLLFSLVLLGLFTPVLTVNSLLTAVKTYGGITYIYPSPVIILAPWSLMLMILSFFISCIVVFIVVISILSSRVSLFESLNSNWTETGPYVEGI